MELTVLEIDVGSPAKPELTEVDLILLRIRVTSDRFIEGRHHLDVDQSEIPRPMTSRMPGVTQYIYSSELWHVGPTMGSGDGALMATGGNPRPGIHAVGELSALR